MAKKKGKTVTKKKKTTQTKKNKTTKNMVRVKSFLADINPRILVIVIFFTATVLIFSTYAWLSASLNVKVKFFDLSVSSDRGLFISVDGINFSSDIDISLESVITELKDVYPSNTNQWASGGLWPVSTVGLKDSNSGKFDVYWGEMSRRRGKNKVVNRYLTTKLSDESVSTHANKYIAFDIFLKNISGSPHSDNLYFEDTYIDFDNDKYLSFLNNSYEELVNSMSGIMNSLRIGIIKYGSVPHNASVREIQNVQCNNACEMVIYEPNSRVHSLSSIEDARELDIIVEDGMYYPTYAVIKEGVLLQHRSGLYGTNLELDAEHFAVQNTIKGFDESIFEIPNAITKLRVYVWIEGQDIDSIETTSSGAAISIVINLVKDLASYE